MSVLLDGWPHHARHSFGHLLPLRFFDQELLPAFLSQAVVFEFPISVWRSFPFGDDPPSSLQAMQRGIEGAVLHLQEFIRGPLNVLPDLVTMGRSIEQGPQDEHVKRSLEQSNPLRCLPFHGRHSTLDLATMVLRRELAEKAYFAGTTGSLLGLPAIQANVQVQGGEESYLAH
jgi:hypothetical protein